MDTRAGVERPFMCTHLSAKKGRKLNSLVTGKLIIDHGISPGESERREELFDGPSVPFVGRMRLNDGRPQSHPKERCNLLFDVIIFDSTI